MVGAGAGRNMTMAKRFRAIALALTALIAVSAAAQNAPMDLQRPEKVKASKSGPVGNLSAAEAVARANAWLDAARLLTADFVQIGPDGKRSEGQLVVERPGKMSFKYEAPARFEIVADGRSVAIIDHKLNTQDEYFIGQTPLKFLLSDHIDLARDTQVLSVAQDEKAVTIEIEDKATLGGTAHLELIFDPVTFALKQWTVIDAQGYQTVVTLFNVDLTTRPDPDLFHIDESVVTRQLGRRK
jgi:outer membrane lipoprotein-sorting protein